MGIRSTETEVLQNSFGLTGGAEIDELITKLHCMLNAKHCYRIASESDPIVRQFRKGNEFTDCLKKPQFLPIGQFNWNLTTIVDSTNTLNCPIDVDELTKEKECEGAKQFPYAQTPSIETGKAVDTKAEEKKKKSTTYSPLWL